MGASRQTPVAWTKDDFKWSLNASKKLSAFSILMQIASDHLKPIDHTITPVQIEALSNSKSWYYALRIQVSL